MPTSLRSHIHTFNLLCTILAVAIPFRESCSIPYEEQVQALAFWDFRDVSLPFCSGLEVIQEHYWNGEEQELWKERLRLLLVEWIETVV